MRAFITDSWHYLSGLGTIGAISGLAAVGVVSGSAALPIIAGIGSALVGGGLVAKGTSPPTRSTP